MTHSGASSPAAGAAPSSQASQLSAMFDDALPAAECELLARRLASDAGMQRQWARYALIGAVLRGDPLCGARGAPRAPLLDGGLAGRVQAVLASEPGLGVGEGSPDGTRAASRSAAAAQPAPRRWGKPAAAGAIAASVAALALLWLQREAGEGPAVAAAPTGPTAAEVVAPQVAGAAAMPDAAEVVLAPARGGEPESYIVPALPAATVRPVGSTQLANFVVAHSEVSGSLARRSVLSALVSGESASGPATAVDAGLDRADAGQPAEAAR